MKTYQLFYILFISLAVISCNNDKTENINPNDKGTLTLHFDNVVGPDDLILNTGTYTNASNETFTVKTLRYYISNIKLTTTGNKEHVVPQGDSYFLVDEADAESQDIELENIPAADYNKVTFTIGVDSLASANPNKQTGVLDTASASTMYWNLNQGYIFFDMEGKSSASANGNYTYWIGGYGGATSKTANNLKTITLSFGTGRAEVRTNIAPEAHLHVDVLAVFNAVTPVSIKEHPMVGFDDYATTLANNYATMITYGHVHNDPKK